MVSTRSGASATPAVQQRDKKKKTKYLLCRMFRENGDDSVHKCSICMSRFMLLSNLRWMQCPICKDVFHEKCIEDFAMKTNNITSLRCPSCRSAELPFYFENTASHVLVEWDHNKAENWWYEGVDVSSEESETSDASN
jgi:hypothetical protein